MQATLGPVLLRLSDNGCPQPDVFDDLSGAKAGLLGALCVLPLALTCGRGAFSTFHFCIEVRSGIHRGRSCFRRVAMSAARARASEIVPKWRQLGSYQWYLFFSVRVRLDGFISWLIAWTIAF